MSYTLVFIQKQNFDKQNVLFHGPLSNKNESPVIVTFMSHKLCGIVMWNWPRKFHLFYIFLMIESLWNLLILSIRYIIFIHYVTSYIEIIEIILYIKDPRTEDVIFRTTGPDKDEEKARSVDPCSFSCAIATLIK